MTSKEMEARSGVPRANIRYYEAEGLLAPARSGNGYRDYSEEDLRTLEKIKLLRRLGVTIEALRALRDGRAELSAVLDRRLAEVGGEQAALGRVERVCGDLRRTGATFTGLDPGRYLADLDAPALPGEGGPWWEKASASALPETDRLPTVCSASRRLFARMFDEMLVRVLIASGLCLAGINLAAVSSFVVSLTAVVLLAFVEPLFLRLWGTTPGKALLGMRLTGPDGKNVPYTEGLARYFLMMWYGQGFEIPVWSLIQGYRSVRRCWNDEPQPWDVEVAYIAKPFRARELLSRIRSVLRRTNAAASLLRLGDVEVDAGAACVRKAGRDVALTALEYRLLLLFAQSQGKLVTREHVRNAIWDSAGEYVSDNTLSVYIKRLRDKVEDDPGNPRLILTVRGLGYRTGA